MHEKTVLILDANQRSALACTRALGRAGVSKIYTSDSSKSSLAGESKYCTAYFALTSPQSDPNQFLKDLKILIHKKNIDFILPMTEISIRLILKNANLFAGCVLPFADFDTIFTVSDKNRLMQRANRLKIKIPETKYFESLSEWNYESEVNFPFVIKPSFSRLLIDEKWIGTTVRIVKNKVELIKHIRNDTYLRCSPFMIQEFVHGHGEGVFALYNDGLPICHFSHQRIREKPPSGGVSVLCKSTLVKNNLKEIADRLLKSFNWSGVAMVEFRIDANGAAYLMEINTRFWGSLQLSIDAGVNFPVLLYRQFTGANKTEHISYESGAQLRWFLGDLDNLYLYLRDKNKTRKQKFTHFLHFLKFNKNTRNEILRADDWRPAIFELKVYLKQLFFK